MKSIARKIIQEVIREVFLSEYITKDEVYLRDYLSMTEEQKKEYLPHEFHYFFEDFLAEDNIDFDMPKEKVPSNYQDEPDEEVDMFDSTIELMTWLEKNNREIYDSFSNYLYRKIMNNELPIPESDYPAWSYFEDNPVLVKNQWLIHFTNDSEAISSDGFKYGVDDMTKLGLTTHLGEFDKKYGGYNFAYLLSDFLKYAKGNYSRGGRGYKYGDEAVIFRASGIKVWHHGDQEPQVIFYGNTASNIIPITSGENSDWSVKDRNDRVIFESDELERVVDWVVNNYQQYRKSLHEAYIGSDGNLVGFDNKFNYPYDEIWELIKDYVLENRENWEKFGWSIFDAHNAPSISNKYKSESVFRVEKIDEFDDWDDENHILDILETDEQAYDRAKKVGFILDEDGIVLGLNGINLVDKLNESIELKDIGDDDGYWDRVKIIAKNKKGEEVGYAILDMVMHPESEFGYMDDNEPAKFSDEDIEQHFPEDFAARLEHIEVYPKFRKSGFGKELMDAVVKYVKSRDYKTLYLIASPVGFEPRINLDALSKFYSRYGFKVVKDFGNAHDMIAQLREEESKKNIYTKEIDSSYDEQIYKLIGNQFASYGTSVIGLFDGDKLIGGVLLEEDYLPWEYRFDMVINKRYRNKGYASLLIKSLIEKFNKDSQAEQLSAFVINDKLMHLLKKFDFYEDEFDGMRMAFLNKNN